MNSDGKSWKGTVTDYGFGESLPRAVFGVDIGSLDKLGRGVWSPNTKPMESWCLDPW